MALASLGHAHASVVAALGLRICTSCNTLRLGYTKINFSAFLALWVFVQVAGANSVASSHTKLYAILDVPAHICAVGLY
jgi:hypothetical protein